MAARSEVNPSRNVLRCGLCTQPSIEDGARGETCCVAGALAGLMLAALAVELGDPTGLHVPHDDDSTGPNSRKSVPRVSPVEQG